VIIIGYDGSPDARVVIRQAGTLMPGYPAVVLTIYESVDLRDAAWRHAAEGAHLAHELGIDATARVRQLSETIADTIMSEAIQLNGHAIVVGRRGIASPGSDGCEATLGSVSEAVLRGAPCAVMVGGASCDAQPVMVPSLLMGTPRG
jgi:nucleotide-binding universal stress UspA family protein